ncbi:lens fiber membrane intrinsic protein [Alligator sinensis]|uniref:Lens fiber membrane intrinsic protein n=1 Tax=Alligator sinensis TaxID=38654 RepID=A0A3Q0HI86_ALLSI|nr:lens fiber membrane intrinsic protein [Alligator sinensis]
MHSLMGGGLLCAVSGLVLLIVATATDFWMQYRYSGNLSHQGLWRYCVGGKCHVHTITIGAALRAVARMPLIQNAATRILSAFWDATRAFMLLSILSCFAGIILGLTTFSSSARLTRTRMAGITLLIAGLLALLGLSIYTGVTVNVFAKRYEDWRFSWSYILGWVGVILTISAGVFHLFAFSKDSSVDSSAVASS